MTHLFNLIRKLFAHPNGTFHVLSLFIDAIILELLQLLDLLLELLILDLQHFLLLLHLSDYLEGVVD